MEEEIFCQCGEKIHRLGPEAWANDRGQLCCWSAEHIPQHTPEIINHSSSDRRYTPDGRYVASSKYDSSLERCTNCEIQIGLIDGEWNNPLAGPICQFRHHTPVDSQ